MARPGGNITGFTQSDFDLGGKWLQLLKEIAPGITAAAIITSPLSPLAPLNDRSRAVGYMPSVEDAARSMGISVSLVEISNPIEIEEKISGLKPHQGVIFPPNSFISAHRARIIELLRRFRVPGVYFARFFVSDGGLIPYRIDQPDLFRQGGGYVDRILRGTNLIIVLIEETSPRLTTLSATFFFNASLRTLSLTDLCSLNSASAA